MTDLDELMALRPQLDSLMEENDKLRREARSLHELIDAKESVIAGLKASLVAIRELQNRTPPMGTRTKETDMITRKNGEHG